MITRLAHVCLHARDLEKTARFYIDGLGLEMGFEFIKDGALFGYYIKLGGQSFIEVFKGEPGGEGTIQHVALEVSDIDAAIERLKQHGYPVGEKSLGPDHAWQVWTEDPNGVRIEFHQYTEQSMQLVGGQCLVTW